MDQACTCTACEENILAQGLGLRVLNQSLFANLYFEESSSMYRAGPAVGDDDDDCELEKMVAKARRNQSSSHAHAPCKPPDLLDRS